LSDDVQVPKVLQILFHKSKKDKTAHRFTSL